MPRLWTRHLFITSLFLFAIWLYVVLPFLYTVPRYSHDEATNKCSAEESKNHGFWEKASCDPTAYFTLWLVAFTGVLAVSTIGLWVSTILLWRSGERQAEFTQAALIGDQRAWMMVSLDIESFQFGPIVDGAADVRSELIFHIQNVGRTPALNATLNFALIGNFSTSATAIREFAKAHNTASEFDGRLVSPGESYDEELTARAPGSELYQYGRNGLITPLIVGCITYQILQDSKIHQTAFAFRPYRWGEDDPRIFVTGGDLDSSDVEPAVASGWFIT